MIFDSVYDVYRGVITYVRVIDGRIEARDRIKMMSTGAVHELLEIGVISPEPMKAGALGVGEVGYLITGVKDVRQSRVGDTVTINTRPAKAALGGYKDPKPMVYSGLYPIDGSDYPNLRDALDKLKLNDAALQLRAGDLGRARLRLPLRLPRPAAPGDHPGAAGARVRPGPDLDRAERGLPGRAGRRHRADGHQPERVPRRARSPRSIEPVVRATVLTPNDYVGAVMELCQGRRGTLLGMDYLSADRVELRYTLPLAEIIYDFFDQLKSRTKGYASLDYEPSGEQEADLVKVDILLHGEPVDAFSAIVHKDKAYNYGVAIAAKLRELIPRQQFEVPIQAAIGSRVIARETIRAIRKDVLAKCYGGDITRKRKLLEKQKEGKKRMKMVGRVEVPQEAFIAALSTSDTPPTRRAPAARSDRRRQVLPALRRRRCPARRRPPAPRAGTQLCVNPRPTGTVIIVRRRQRFLACGARTSRTRGLVGPAGRLLRRLGAAGRRGGPGGPRGARRDRRAGRVRRHVRRAATSTRTRRCRCSTASGWPPSWMARSRSTRTRPRSTRGCRCVEPPELAFATMDAGDRAIVAGRVWSPPPAGK